MGHPQSARCTKRKVLQLLRRTVSRYFLQHYVAPENPFLHSQPDHSVRRHFVPVGARLLFAQRFGREDLTLYQHFAVVDCVLPASGRNHSAHLADGAVAGQVPVIHDDAGHVISRRDDSSAKC